MSQETPEQSGNSSNNSSPNSSTNSMMIPSSALLIAGGVLLFLGLGRGGTFSILSYWPLILIAISLGIMLGKPLRWPVIIGGIILAAILSLFSGLGGSKATTHDIKQGLERAKEAEIVISTGVSKLTIDSIGRGNSLIEGTIDTVKGETLETSFEKNGNKAKYELKSQKKGSVNLISNQDKDWELSLTRSVPLSLDIDTGIGETTLSLSDLELETLKVDAGIGELTVRLPKEGNYDIDLDTGVGEVTVYIPNAVGSRIQVDKGIGSLSLPDNMTFTRNGDELTSTNYSNSKHTANIEIDAGIGSISIRYE